MPTMVPRKPYERLLIRTKWLLLSSSAGTLSSCQATANINPAVQTQLSPRRAERAAMLKARFADTISKAKQKKLFEYDPINTILVEARKKRIAAATVEYEKAKKIARQNQLQRLRAKARHDLEKMKMEATHNVSFEDNVKTIDELGKLAACSDLCYPFNGEYSLQKLGIRLKDSGMSYDDIEDSIFLNQDIEEGEIVDYRVIN